MNEFKKRDEIETQADNRRDTLSPEDTDRPMWTVRHRADGDIQVGVPAGSGSWGRDPRPALLTCLSSPYLEELPPGITATLGNQAHAET